jgi:hypothetical protein
VETGRGYRELQLWTDFISALARTRASLATGAPGSWLRSGPGRTRDSSRLSVNRRRDSVRIEPRTFRLRAAGPRCEAPGGFGRPGASRSERSFGISSMSGARWATASVFGRKPLCPSPPVALRKEAVGVVREAQVSWMRNGAPAASQFFRIQRRGREESARTRVSSSLGKDLEGERSPGRIGRSLAGNGWMSVTDPTAEQGLEAGAPVRQASKGRFWQRSRFGEGSRAGGNGKGATATVTWCGCGRGESFEGCEKRRGECIGTPTVRKPGSPGSRVEPEPDDRKRDEPHDWQRDATSPQPPERRKSPRWCKTTRAKQDSEAGSLGTEPGRQQCRFGGVDARKGCRWRGVTTPELRGAAQAARSARFTSWREP